MAKTPVKGKTTARTTKSKAVSKSISDTLKTSKSKTGGKKMPLMARKQIAAAVKREATALKKEKGKIKVTPSKTAKKGGKHALAGVKKSKAHKTAISEGLKRYHASKKKSVKAASKASGTKLVDGRKKANAKKLSPTEYAKWHKLANNAFDAREELRIAKDAHKRLNSKQSTARVAKAQAAVHKAQAAEKAYNLGKKAK